MSGWKLTIFNILKSLWELSFDFSSKNLESSHYAYFAHKYDIKNWRILKSSSVIGLEGLPQHVLRFVAQRGEVLAMFEFFDVEKTKPVFIVLRDLESKEFLVWGYSSGLLYGYSSLNLNIDKPIVLVEGVLDCEVCKLFNPNCLAVLTSRLSKSQIGFLKQLNKKIILFYDNDVSGLEGAQKDYSLLKLMGFEVSFLSHFPKIKDAGELAFLEWSVDKNYENLKSYLSSKLK